MNRGFSRIFHCNVWLPESRSLFRFSIDHPFRMLRRFLVNLAYIQLPTMAWREYGIYPQIQWLTSIFLILCAINIWVCLKTGYPMKPKSTGQSSRSPLRLSFLGGTHCSDKPIWSFWSIPHCPTNPHILHLLAYNMSAYIPESLIKYLHVRLESLCLMLASF